MDIATLEQKVLSQSRLLRFHHLIHIAMEELGEATEVIHRAITERSSNREIITEFSEFMAVISMINLEYLPDGYRIQLNPDKLLMLSVEFKKPAESQYGLSPMSLDLLILALIDNHFRLNQALSKYARFGGVLENPYSKRSGLDQVKHCLHRYGAVLRFWLDDGKPGEGPSLVDESILIRKMNKIERYFTVSKEQGML